MLFVNSLFSIFANSEDFNEMSLVSRIRDLSKEKNLNLKTLEERAGFGNGTIRRWDNSPPSADKLLKIANLLNTSCEYLLTGNNYKIETSEFEMELLSLFRQLPRDAQLEFKGELKGYLKCLERQPVAADQPIRKAK